jgi:hypothetical protein
VKTQKTGNVRGKGNQEGVWNNRSDTVVLNAAPFRIWDTLKKFHPHSKEILTVARILRRMGARHNMIAAALGLQDWKDFCGINEWTSEDVIDILDGYRV